MLLRRLYFAGKSIDSWAQLPINDQLVIKIRLRDRDGLVCNPKNGHGCGKKFVAGRLTIDHVIPISQGGPVSDIGNMQLLCARCHAKKTRKEQYK